MTSLRVVDFSFAYEADQPNILNKINLDLTPGSFNLMVGPSGSGKSTLLKAMAGLLPKGLQELGQAWFEPFSFDQYNRHIRLGLG
ncbi:ATP-binding cassette domain-containing protein [Weissella confusa]|uniref:ATP-binding cassette domain-containing protein n=1 Tax=Weissella confusa TaxID=1583 RepID=A0A923SP34_WEICO|nr:ATP-binding cassette domain-containing protein [Weissella confusa]